MLLTTLYTLGVIHCDFWYMFIRRNIRSELLANSLLHIYTHSNIESPCYFLKKKFALQDAPIFFTITRLCSRAVILIFTNLTETFHPFLSYPPPPPQIPLPQYLESILLSNCRSLLIIIVCVSEVWYLYYCVWLISFILCKLLATLTA